MANQTFVVQGILSTTANDTFIQSIVTTGLTGQDNSAFRIKEMLVEHPQLPNVLAQVKSEWQLTRGSKSAMVNYSDTSLILRGVKYQQLAGTGFGVVYDAQQDIIPQSDLIVVETQIYLGFKTTAFAALATVQYKLILEEIKISADQRIAILSSRLP